MNKRGTEKELSPINSVTDHYQKIMGAPQKVYTDNIGKWMLVLVIGIMGLTLGLGIYYFLFVR